MFPDVVSHGLGDVREFRREHSAMLTNKTTFEIAINLNKNPNTLTGFSMKSIDQV